jgi:lysine 2,3-aminomutase
MTTNCSSNPKYLVKLEQIKELNTVEKEQLKAVTDTFVFRTNDYYQSLIDWSDPKDPIRHIVMPQVAELEEFGKWDASDEASYTVIKGLEHKYSDTALLLVNNVCGAYCRFSFRKRLFTNDNDEVTNEVSAAVEYIRQHPEINNVLLTGGDPLLMSTGKLEKIIQQVRSIDHVKIIRIGSKMPAFNPFRIINDPSLLEMLSRYSSADKKIYVMAHFNHAKEMTDVAVQGIMLLQKAGITVFNQTPIIRGVNDNIGAIGELFSRMSFNGVTSYYLFICRPTAGNRPYVVPVEEAWNIFEGARHNLAGLAKHARLCMSHKTGKVEVVGRSGNHMVFRYHRAARTKDSGRIMIFPSNPDACWLDDYLQPVELQEQLFAASLVS